MQELYKIGTHIFSKNNGTYSCEFCAAELYETNSKTTGDLLNGSISFSECESFV